MSIVIQNIRDDDTPNIGRNRYLVRINQTVICEFDHDRQVDGLAQCLRDAADAVDEAREVNIEKMVQLLSGSWDE